MVMLASDPHSLDASTIEPTDTGVPLLVEQYVPSPTYCSTSNGTDRQLPIVPHDIFGFVGKEVLLVLFCFSK